MNGPGRRLLGLYRAVSGLSAPALKALLAFRARRGREDPARLGERMGRPGLARPPGPLIWLHAASVGEALSALPLIDRLRQRTAPPTLLVTTGTVTSAAVMAQRLPAGVLHQFYPLDHPAWTASFLDHWTPSCVLWMESELWPNMLGMLRQRGVPAALVNARLSPRSVRRWQQAGGAAHDILSAFSLCLAQTPSDAAALRTLGATGVWATDNLKYGAAALPYDPAALETLRRTLKERPLWVFASTHAGEEAMACRLHRQLRRDIPGLLTILIPRHPERRAAVMDCCLDAILGARLRGSTGALPRADDDVYIVDTLGELGLFYRLSPLACIGRSFSDDGGGGHNPIEAARLGCAVLHGPLVQNLEAIYAEMDAAGAALRLADENALQDALTRFMTRPDLLPPLQQAGQAFARDKAEVLERVMTHLGPFLSRAGLGPDAAPGKSPEQPHAF